MAAYKSSQKTNRVALLHSSASGATPHTKESMEELRFCAVILLEIGGRKPGDCGEGALVTRRLLRELDGDVFCLLSAWSCPAGRVMPCPLNVAAPGPDGMPRSRSMADGPAVGRREEDRASEAAGCLHGGMTGGNPPTGEAGGANLGSLARGEDKARAVFPRLSQAS